MVQKQLHQPYLFQRPHKTEGIKKNRIHKILYKNLASICFVVPVFGTSHNFSPFKFGVHMNFPVYNSARCTFSHKPDQFCQTLLWYQSIASSKPKWCVMAIVSRNSSHRLKPLMVMAELLLQNYYDKCPGKMLFTTMKQGREIMRWNEKMNFTFKEVIKGLNWN